MTGAITIRPDGDQAPPSSSTPTFTAHVPLVGRKVEGFAAPIILGVIDAEERTAQAGRRDAMTRPTVVRAGRALSPLALAGCTATSAGARHDRGRPPASERHATGGTATRPPGTDCPTTYAAPDPNRPRVRAGVHRQRRAHHGRGHRAHRVHPGQADHRTGVPADGQHRPDVSPPDNSIRVTSAHGRPRWRRCHLHRGGRRSATQGGLLHIPFASTVAAGTAVTADLAFTVTLGAPVVRPLRPRRAAARAASRGSPRPSRCSPGNAATAGTPRT